MPVPIFTIPSTATLAIRCPGCAALLHYHMISKQWPHLYCTYCHNVYVQLSDHPRLREIGTNFFSKKAMQRIEGEARLCRCGGMFLFRTRVHCVHCGEPLPFDLPKRGGRDRLRYSDMIVFDGSEVIYSNGRSKIFRFEK